MLIRLRRMNLFGGHKYDSRKKTYLRRAWSAGREIKELFQAVYLISSAFFIATSHIGVNVARLSAC